jgi:DNA-binding response OmpR family regulator
VRLLLVEDDDRVAAAQQDALRRHGFDVLRVCTGQAALDSMDDPDWPPDVVLLDLGLPDGDGFEVCAAIRRSSEVPILVSTARSDLRSRVHGLHLGADDYLVKPYDVRELMARIHAVTRRSQPRTAPADPPGQAAAGGGTARTAPPPLAVRGVTVDVARREVSVGGTAVALTRKEFDVLALLAREPGIVFRREQILAEVWGAASPTTGPAGVSHTLDVHVASLRAKTGVPGVVETVRGVGYRLGSPEPPAPAGG